MSTGKVGVRWALQKVLEGLFEADEDGAGEKEVGGYIVKELS